MAVAPEELQGRHTVITQTTPLGLLVIGGVVCIALAESPVAPLVAGFLAAALVYQGLALYGQLHG